MQRIIDFMEKLPEDRILFYISVRGVPDSANDDDIYGAFPEAYINNIFPIPDEQGCFDLQFKNRDEVIKAVDCHDDTIKGEKISIAFSGVTRQAPPDVRFAQGRKTGQKRQGRQELEVQ